MLRAVPVAAVAAVVAALAPAAPATAGPVRGPDGAAPSVRWELPAGGAVVRGTVFGSACRVRAKDDRPGLRVEIFAGDRLIAVQRRAPYTCRWDTRSSSGRVALRAVAIDRAGRRRTATRRVTVANPVRPAAPAPAPSPAPAPAPSPSPSPSPAAKGGVPAFPAGPGATAPAAAVAPDLNVASSVFAAGDAHLFAVDQATLALMRLDGETLAETGRFDAGAWPTGPAVDPRTGDVLLIDVNDPQPSMLVRRVGADGRPLDHWSAPAGDMLTSLTVAGDGAVYLRFSRMREDEPDELTTEELVRVLGPDLTTRAVWTEPAHAEHHAGAPDGTLFAAGCPRDPGAPSACRVRVLSPGGDGVRAFGLGSTELVSAVAADAWGTVWVQSDGESWPGSELRRYSGTGTLLARYTQFDGQPRLLHRLAVSPNGGRVYVAYAPEPRLPDRQVLTRLVP